MSGDDDGDDDGDDGDNDVMVMIMVILLIIQYATAESDIIATEEGEAVESARDRVRYTSKCLTAPPPE